MSNHISDLILWHNFKDNIQIDENKKKNKKKNYEFKWTNYSLQKKTKHFTVLKWWQL